MAIKNATPRAIFPGFDDQSGRELVAEQEAIPQSLPFYYGQFARGPLVPQMCAGNSLLKTFGDKSFDVRGKFYNPHIHAIETTLGNGNASVFVKRVVDDTATRATIALGLEIVEADIPEYARDSSYVITRDDAGAKIVVDGGTPLAGYKARWVTIEVAAGTDISTLTNSVGTLTGKGGSVATIYPIMAFETFFGEDYNNMGIRLSAPVTGSDTIDKSVVTDQRAMLYRAQLVERSVTGTVIGLSTIDSAKMVEFALKEGVFNRKTNIDLPAEQLVDKYQDLYSAGIPTYGPFESMYVYYNNIATIGDLILAGETAASHLDIDDAALLNLLTGVAYDGSQHYTFELSSDTLAMDGNSTIFASGGSDGEVSAAKLGLLIIDEMNYNWENPEYALTDMRKFPFSKIYDTGFPIETKLALAKSLGYRPDIMAYISTQDISEPLNTVAEESSIANVIAAAIALNPESALNGTGACRAVISGHGGFKPNDKYKKPLCLVETIIASHAQYMGAGNGKMKSAFAYDRYPRNQISGFVGVNNPWKPDSVRDTDWESGLNYVQWSDRNTLFRPALQTVCKDSTSILNSEIVVGIMADITKLLGIIWIEHTGRSDLSAGQFQKSCVERFNQLSAGRYDGRVTLVPVCYYTPADEARGYSWTMDVSVYANNMKTVGTFNVIARRSSDLAA